ncbi:type II secretion system F family protein [Amycolatopsis tucumanensis]|uniref:Type II secretion system protein GspF domain-containing protein n=1 Tax=Amycolatopsis tucumanensis TaxID=401106 RepID=A0ABP7JQX1_9PSEU|nr:type II secretion system F family protein [Amycolatopsis tucumanensis]MCF6424974.1 type II secretion system F family protein [Amycolatopsis tucumanensis]
MTLDTAVAAVFGLGAAAGILLILAALRRPAGTVSSTSAFGGRLRAVRGQDRDRRFVLGVVLAVGAGLLTGAVTGWVVGGVLTGAAVWFLPRLVGPDRAHARRVARMEAIASWTEMLRDVLAAAAGLEQAILATAPLAPAPIRGEITTLAARLESGQRLAPALRGLAGELADPTADLVIASLVLAAEHQARQLGDLLGSLATTAREQAAMRMRVETGRARTRTSVRVIVATTLAFAAGVVVFNRAYLGVYDTVTGQFVLLLIGGLFVAGFAWLSRIAAGGDQARVLTLDVPAVESTAPAAPGGERA